MREDECITATRLSARIGDADDDFTDARIRVELGDTLRQVFGEKVCEARSGAWLKQQYNEVTAGKWRYRIPYRAIAGAESVELSDAQLDYEIQGDQIVFASQPTEGSWVLFTYYLRPSALYQYQTTGAVTAVDTDALTVTVNTLPTNRVTSATIATGDRLDIVHANGWHELALVGAQSTIASTTLTFPDGTDLQDVEVGDYVRAAEQTDWPCIPDEFHRCLCDMTAARIQRTRGYEEKAAALEMQAGGDIARFATLLEPRVKDAGIIAVPTGILLRGGMRARRSDPNNFSW